MKAPGTSGTMPIKGAACGIRPNLAEMSTEVAFDFSKAKEFLSDLPVPDTLATEPQATDGSPPPSATD